jgi:hypothetical protein
VLLIRKVRRLLIDCAVNRQGEEAIDRIIVRRLLIDEAIDRLGEGEDMGSDQEGEDVRREEEADKRSTRSQYPQSTCSVFYLLMYHIYISVGSFLSASSSSDAVVGSKRVVRL